MWSGIGRVSGTGAGSAFFIIKAQRELQLQVPVRLEVRHRYRQERDGLLVRVSDRTNADRTEAGGPMISEWARALKGRRTLVLNRL